MLAPDPTLPAVVGVVFLATLVRSAFGFGEALVAVPLLALVIPVRVAVPLATLLSITVAGLILAQDWRHAHAARHPHRPARPDRGATVRGQGGDGGRHRRVLVLLPAGRRKPQFPDDRFAWAFGLGAGVLGGAYGMNGPPLVVYATLRGWTPEHFRATLQGYFLPASAAGMCGFWAAGLWVP